MKKNTILIACILAVQLLTGALTAGAAPATAGPCQNCGSVDYYNPGPGYYPGQAYGASYAPADYLAPEEFDKGLYSVKAGSK